MARKRNRELDAVRLYDNGGGALFGRFTAVFTNWIWTRDGDGREYAARSTPLGRAYPCLHLSETGERRYGEAVPGRSLGRRIAFHDLPPACQEAVLDALKD